MFDLTGKCALVTGATGGIGGAVAKSLHAQGATVALSGTRAEKLEALAAELGERALLPLVICQTLRRLMRYQSKLPKPWGACIS